MDNFAIGKYTASLNLKYGDNKTSSNQIVFWVVPWQILTLITGLLILLIIIIKTTMKKYNKRLVEKVKKETLTSQRLNITPTENVAEKEEKLRDNIEPSMEAAETENANPKE